MPPLRCAVVRRSAIRRAGDRLRVSPGSLPNCFYVLPARDAGLVVRARGRSDITITPFAKDVFVGDWVGIVKFSRDARGQVTGFTVNRMNVRGVQSERATRR